jgi:arsenite oxidase small subunit
MGDDADEILSALAPSDSHLHPSDASAGSGAPPPNAPKPKSSAPDTVRGFPRLTRRQLLTYTGYAGIAVLAGGVLESILTRGLPGGVTQALSAYPRTRIANLHDLHPNKPLAFDYPATGQPNYLIQLGAPALDGIGPRGDIVAYSVICVHMGCALAGRYKSSQHALGPCPCHLSTYDLSLGGMPVIGAATENLPQIELSVDANGEIFADGIWGTLYGVEDNRQISAD